MYIESVPNRNSPPAILLRESYREGKTCPLARRGYGRDGKPGLPIVVYGLLADSEGRPAAVDVYPGDTGDPSTVADQAEKLCQRFGLSRVVLVGERGMLTQAQIGTLKRYPQLGWVTALRAPAVAELARAGRLQRSLFDDARLAEISSPDFPGERLVACFNPLLAEERARKRREMLACAEHALERVAKEVARRTKKPLPAAEIGAKAKRAVGRWKMRKHFSLRAADGHFSWERDEASVAKEAALDGIYVIRTSEPAERMGPEEALRSYKALAQVERGFRCLKGLDILVRPIRHRLEPHVRAHVFLCMLAYYVEWHMRRALAPLLFDDEDLPEARRTRDPSAPPEPSASAKRKKASKETADGQTVHSFDTLLKDLGTLCRNLCRAGEGASAGTFPLDTEATSLQAKAFELLGV